jgi:hypothetical protein
MQWRTDMGWATSWLKNQNATPVAEASPVSKAGTLDAASDGNRRKPIAAVRAEAPAMGFLGHTLQQIIDGGLDGEEERLRTGSDEEFEAVADRYRETPYLAQLAATHRARARSALRWRPRYLAAYAVSANHTWASDAAGVNRKTVELHAKNDAIFQEQCLEAERRASDLLFGACFKSAIEGDSRPVYQQGVCVGYVREYDSRMRVEMLRALRPHQFKTPGNGNVTVNSGTGAGATIVMTEEKLKLLQERRRVALEGMAEARATAVDQATGGTKWT